MTGKIVISSAITQLLQMCGNIDEIDQFVTRTVTFLSELISNRLLLIQLFSFLFFFLSFFNDTVFAVIQLAAIKIDSISIEMYLYVCTCFPLLQKSTILFIIFFLYGYIFTTKGNKNIINQQKNYLQDFFASLVTNILVSNLCEIYAVSASAMPYSKGIFSFIVLLGNKKQTKTCTE